MSRSYFQELQRRMQDFVMRFDSSEVFRGQGGGDHERSFLGYVREFSDKISSSPKWKKLVEYRLHVSLHKRFVSHQQRHIKNGLNLAGFQPISQR